MLLKHSHESMSDVPDPSPHKPLPSFLCTQSSASQKGNQRAYRPPIGPAIPVPHLTRKLYRPGAVAWAAVVGGPLAAGVMLAINYHRLGRRGDAIKCATGGLLSALGLVVLGLNLPVGLAAGLSGISVVVVLASYRLAGELQGQTLAQHERNGGRVGSAWFGGAVGVTCAVAVTAGLFVWWLALGSPTGIEELPNRLTDASGMHEVLYSRDIAQADANTVCLKLSELGHFRSGQRATVGLSIEGNRRIFWFFIDSETARDAKARAGAQVAARETFRALRYYRGTLRLITPEGIELGDEDIDLSVPAHRP
jgi:hypothetical protein